MLIFFSLNSQFNGLGIHFVYNAIETRPQLPSRDNLVCRDRCRSTEPLTLFDAKIYFPQVGINLVESDVCFSQLLDNVQVIGAHLNIIV